MAAPAQRRAMGTLFLCLALAFAGVAAAAVEAHTQNVARWIVLAAAAVLALWFATLSFRALRQP